MKIDWKGCGFITWDDVCSYFILEIKDENFLEKQIPFLGQPNVIKFSTLKVCLLLSTIDSIVSLNQISFISK